MTYHIGQTLPLDASHAITGAPIAKVWFALRVPPQKERACREYLKARGIHACYPERDSTHRRRGKKIVRTLPIISQIVYAKFEAEPRWHILKARRIITGVFARDSIPIEIPGDVIRNVMGLPTVEEELEAARRDMLRVRPGDRATIKGGPLDGVLVDVEAVAHGRVWFATLTGVKGSGAEGSMERQVIDT